MEIVQALNRMFKVFTNTADKELEDSQGAAVQKTKQLVRNKKGQSTVEYILILFVVVLIVMKFKESILGRMTAATDKLGDKIDQAIE